MTSQKPNTGSLIACHRGLAVNEGECTKSPDELVKNKSAASSDIQPFVLPLGLSSPDRCAFYSRPVLTIAQ